MSRGLRGAVLLLLGMLPAPLAAQDTLTVFAAADLAHTLEELGPAYTRRTGTVVLPVLGASGQLATQIERGAPADLFFSANTGFIDRLIAGGHLLGGTRTVYARGRIVLAWPRGAPPLRGLGDLLAPAVKRIAIAHPETAPYGMAARQALVAQGLWERVEAKLVIGENVRQALQYVQTGAVDAAIVAQSVAAVPEVGSMLLPEALHAPIDQGAAVVARSPRQRQAAGFLAFVTGEGWPVMERRGFSRPPPP